MYGSFWNSAAPFATAGRHFGHSTAHLNDGHFGGGGAAGAARANAPAFSSAKGARHLQNAIVAKRKGFSGQSRAAAAVPFQICTELMELPTLNQLLSFLNESLAAESQSSSSIEVDVAAAEMMYRALEVCFVFRNFSFHF